MKIKEMTKQVVEDQLAEKLNIKADNEWAPVLDNNKQVLINFFYVRTKGEYVARNKRKVEFIDLTLDTNILDKYPTVESLLAEIVKPIYKLSNKDFNKTLNL